MMKSIEAPYIEGLDSLDEALFPSAVKKNGAAASVDRVCWPQDYPHAPSCNFWIARGTDSLALVYEVKGPDLRGKALADGGRTWEDSCCEFFISTSPKGYFNFELNCIGTLLGAFGPGREGRVPLPSEDLAKVKRFSTLPREEIEKEGGEYEWSVAMMIPFSLISLDPESLPESVKVNFYKCGDLTAHPHFLSWNLVETPTPDFHRPEYFGELRFR